MSVLFQAFVATGFNLVLTFNPLHSFDPRLRQLDFEKEPGKVGGVESEGGYLSDKDRRKRDSTNFERGKTIWEKTYNVGIEKELCSSFFGDT